MTVTISRTDLVRNTREIVGRLRRGQPVLVQSYGEDQIVFLDALDYRILTALVNYAVGKVSVETAEMSEYLFGSIMHAYLNLQISLAKAVEQMGLSRFELMERFERLRIPLRIGPDSVNEARDEVKTACF